MPPRAALKIDAAWASVQGSESALSRPWSESLPPKWWNASCLALSASRKSPKERTFEPAAAARR